MKLYRVKETLGGQKITVGAPERRFDNTGMSPAMAFLATHLPELSPRNQARVEAFVEERLSARRCITMSAG